MLEAIIAMGRMGQIGLNGGLPWHCSSDLRWFKQMTMGAIVVCGPKTAETLPNLPGRKVIEWDRNRSDQMAQLLLSAGDTGQRVIVIGGAATYRHFAPVIDLWHLGFVDHGGEADTWFDPGWVRANPLSEIGSCCYAGETFTAANIPFSMKWRFNRAHTWGVICEKR